MKPWPYSLQLALVLFIVFGMVAQVPTPGSDPTSNVILGGGEVTVIGLLFWFAQQVIGQVKAVADNTNEIMKRLAEKAIGEPDAK